MVALTLAAVHERIRDRRLEPTERFNVAVALLVKVIADRADGAVARVVSVRDTGARQGGNGALTQDVCKLDARVQQQSRLVMAVLMAGGNRTDERLLLPLLIQ